MEKRIELPGIPDSISQVEEFLDMLREDCQFREDVCGNVVIAVTEAVNNSIYHGSKCNPGKILTILFSQVSPYKICISIMDEGEGFNPDALPDPTSPDLIDKPGGRGVFLMRNLADKVEFREFGRRVDLYFNI
jgi:serine/threonine-protein kinase RsbW